MLQGLFGNASEVDVKSLQKDLDALLATRGYRRFEWQRVVPTLPEQRSQP